MNSMTFIGLDIHKKTISYCAKSESGKVLLEGVIPATTIHLDDWMRTLPQPWTVAMEATMFTGWIYDALRAVMPRSSSFVTLTCFPNGVTVL